MDQKQILHRIKKLQNELSALEIYIKGGDVHSIEAGTDGNHMVVNFCDRAGNKLLAAPVLMDEPGAPLTMLMLRGIWQALKMIPLSELPRYLEDEGPQIQLRTLNPEIFQNDYQVDDELKELHAAMLGHLKNYRVQISELNYDDFKKALQEVM